jgi:hypothetical protein
MYRMLFRAAGLCLASLMGLALADAADRDGKSTEAACGSHGTRVEFYDTPSEAAKVAKKEQKLVFVLHVSGNFEDPRFT